MFEPKPVKILEKYGYMSIKVQGDPFQDVDTVWDVYDNRIGKSVGNSKNNLDLTKNFAMTIFLIEGLIAKCCQKG